LTKQSVQILFDQGCDLVILTCNTASAAALRRMQESWLPTDKRVLWWIWYLCCDGPDAFQNALGPKVKIFSQARLVAESLADYLQRHPDKMGTDTKGKFLTNR